MDIPVEICFHNMPSKPAVETEIRNRIAKLDRLYEHLTGCRVSVEQLHRRHECGDIEGILDAEGVHQPVGDRTGMKALEQPHRPLPVREREGLTPDVAQVASPWLFYIHGSH